LDNQLKEVLMTRSGRTLFTAIVLAAGLLAVVAVGAAARASIASSVTLADVNEGPHSVAYSGKVSSGKAKCVKGRSVSVHEMMGEEPGDHDPLVGPAGETDANGDYEVSGHHPPASGDKFYAEVAKRKVGRKGHKKTCAAALSDAYTY
jgi:hypothetical protein